jgi:NitT/TauT family transport system permease protein
VLPVPVAVLVPLSDALRTGVDEWSLIASNIWPTLSAILVALVFTWVGGVLIGFVLGVSRKFQFVLIVFSSLYAVPFVVMYPLLTVWLAPGQTAKIVFACLYGVIPVVLTTASGVRAIDEYLYRSAVSMGASRRQLLLKVVIPAALPTIMNGLRVGLGLVLIAVIVGEMLVSATGGIGTLITAYRVQFNAGGVYFCILLVILMSVALEQLLRLFQRSMGHR